MDAIFEISTLENPRIPNFIKIGQLLVFGHFLGDPPPKNLSFLVKKSSDLNFDVIFGFSTFEKHYKPIYSNIKCDLYVG